MTGTPITTNTAERASLVDVVAVGHVLTHAAELGLPMPADVLIGAGVASVGGPAVRFDMATLADLTEWALYLDECISTEQLTPSVDHHSVEGQALELPVRLITTVAYDPTVLELVETQPVPYVVTEPGQDDPSGDTSTYSCGRCGAIFGVSGEHGGTLDDDLADEFYQSEVEHHENGDCVGAGEGAGS